MDIYQKRVKLYKAIKNIYRELNKQNIKNSEKPHIVISALFDLQNGNREDIPESIQKLYDDFSDYFAALDIVGNLYSMAGASDGHGLGIVLTPSSVTNLMCDLINVNKNSHVLDLCAGAGAFPVSAINHGASAIKAVELQPSIAKLAFANIGLCDKLQLPDVIVDDAFKFSDYGDFEPDRFLCNPPYSYDEKGMPFVLQGLKYMRKGGLCAVIIMSQAGNGAAVKANQSILKYNTLLCSIKMPDKLFYPAASVGTSIYIFKAGVPHDFKKTVRFIKFDDDGFKRSKKSLNASDNPEQKYHHVLDLWRSDKTFDKHNNECVDDVITDSGDDWNFDKHYEIDLRPKPSDFYKVVAEYQDFKLQQWKHDYDLMMMAKLDGKPVDETQLHSKHFNGFEPDV